MKGGFALAGCLLLAACPGVAAEQGVEFHYTMRGEVRLLLFWIGRDKVGGGHVGIRQGANPDLKERWKEVEVVFGSDPERVPGRISRWGYGVERAVWTLGPEDKLSNSVFEGLIRYSPEESLSEVRAAARRGDARVYPATQSVVEREKARVNQYLFEEKEDFDYRRPEKLVEKFHSEIRRRAPDQKAELKNQPSVYREPQGFLTALDGLCRQITGSPRPTRGRLPSETYVYQARLYRLAVQNLQNLGSSVRAEFEAVNLQKGTRTSFTLTLPTTGERRGVPSQIVFAPRWWLRLRLDLVEVR